MIKINNQNVKEMKITIETIYESLRLLTLSQIENILKSDCNFVLIWVGEEINFIYCDPIPNEELAKDSAKKTDSYYISKDVFKQNILPRLVGL
jgi:hypothetical protein